MKIMRRYSEEINRRLEEMRMQVQVLMTEREPVGILIGDVTGLRRDMHLLQQDFTMIKHNMASELSVLEGTIPNTKEMHNIDIHMVEVDRALVELGTELEANKKGMEFVIEQ
eukprot:10627354-Prorocentrum_lima.AAC.1